MRAIRHNVLYFPPCTAKENQSIHWTFHFSMYTPFVYWIHCTDQMSNGHLSVQWMHWIKWTYFDGKHSRLSLACCRRGQYVKRYYVIPMQIQSKCPLDIPFVIRSTRRVKCPIDIRVSNRCIGRTHVQ